MLAFHSTNHFENSEQNSRLPLIWHLRDFTNAELPEIPDYQDIFSVVAKITSVAS